MCNNNKTEQRNKLRWHLGHFYDKPYECLCDQGQGDDFDHHDNLVASAREGHVLCFRGFMESKICADKSCKAEYSAILAACKCGDFNLETIDMMLKVPDGRSSSGTERWLQNVTNLMIIYGCPSNCVQVVLERGADVNGLDNNGLSPLMCAVLVENTNCITFLLQHGVDLNKLSTLDDEDCETALMMACCMKNTQSLQTLLPYCTLEDINFETADEKWRAVFFACYVGNAESLSLLMKAGAEIEIYDSCENTLLIRAMQRGQVECLEMLLKVVSKNYCRDTIQRSTNRDYLIKDTKCLSIFLHYYDGDLDISYTLYYGNYSLLTWAASHSLARLEFVNIFLDRGADIDQGDHLFGKTALFYVTSKCSKTVDYLIKRGANVDKGTFKNETPVMEAICNSNVASLKLLLAAGAKLETIDLYNQTAFSRAMALHRVWDPIFMKCLLDSGKLLENGVLSELNRASVRRRTSAVFYNTVSLSVTMKAGVLSWEMAHPRTCAKFASAALYAGVCPERSQREGMEFYPLVLAFLARDVDVVKYLLANLYFYPEDVTTLGLDILPNLNLAEESEELVSLLNQVTRQPLTLQALSFLTVSKAISQAGPYHKRSERVEALPIYPSLKEALRFQSDVSRVCRKYWQYSTDVPIGHLVFHKEAITMSEKGPEGHHPVNCEGCSPDYKF